MAFSRPWRLSRRVRVSASGGNKGAELGAERACGPSRGFRLCPKLPHQLRLLAPMA